MTLSIINGSPRGHKSNSKILAEHFLKGYRSKNDQENVITSYLMGRENAVESLELFRHSEQAIIIFPLYTDCMPGIVKDFFEKLPTQEQSGKKKDVGYIVQSGFPEAIHSVYVERYLKKLTQRLGY
ncbi:MAG: NAD(P)H-dependent oxidoreductase, partial [Bacteroidota bacterium]